MRYLSRVSGDGLGEYRKMVRLFHNKSRRRAAD
jgi:hypothetical protein